MVVLKYLFRGERILRGSKFNVTNVAFIAIGWDISAVNLTSHVGLVFWCTVHLTLTSSPDLTILYHVLQKTVMTKS